MEASPITAQGMQLLDLGAGAGKGALRSVYGAGDVIRRGLGMKDRPFQDPKLQQELQPTNPMQKAGQFIEQGAEYALPIPGKKLKAAGTLGKMAYEGARAGLVGGAQSGGDPTQTATQATIGAVIPGIGAVLSDAAPGLKSAAEKIYRRFLLQGGGKWADKKVAENAIPELIKRGEGALTEGGFTDHVEQRIMDSGKKIEAAEDAALKNPSWRAGSYSAKQGTVQMVPPGQIETKPILDEMERLTKEKFLKSGKVPALMQDEYKQWLRMSRDLKSRGQFIPLDQAIALRRQLDQAVAESSGFQKIDLNASKEAMRAGANALRKELARWVPDMAAANKEYSLWAGVNDVIKNTQERKIGHSGGVSHRLMQGAAAIGGLTHGGLSPQGAVEAATGYMLIGAMDNLMRSAATRTYGAIGLDRLADLMQSGQPAEALKYLSLAANQPAAKSANAGAK